jgi:hypothetical protein
MARDVLNIIDERIRRTFPGEPGSGIHALLSLLAAQFMGVPQAAMPDAPPTPAEADVPKTTSPEPQPATPNPPTARGRHA